MFAISQRHGLGLAQGYPSAVSEIPELRSQFRGQRFPNATRVAAHLLTLPTHHWLIDTDTQAIVDHLRDAVQISCPPDTEDVFHREGA